MPDSTQPTPLIFAHRGASTLAPENTLPAFAKAIELGADGVELDVHLTQDGVPVVLHDADLGRYTSSHRVVWDTPFRALQTIDVGRPFHADFTGTRIPTLTQVLTLLAASPLQINLEIKSQPYWHFGIEVAVVRAVREFGLESRVIISSFSPLVLWRLARLAPDLARGQLLNPRAFPFLQARIFGRLLRVTHLHPATSLLTPRLLAYARRCRWKLVVWTANTPETLLHARAVGADIVITDDPRLAQHVYTSVDSPALELTHAL